MQTPGAEDSDDKNTERPQGFTGNDAAQEGDRDPVQEIDLIGDSAKKSNCFSAGSLLHQRGVQKDHEHDSGEAVSDDPDDHTGWPDQGQDKQKK